MSVLTFSQFNDAVKALKAWDPSNEYICKDLTLKAKPKTCWQKFKAIFSSSRSKQLLTAVNILNNYAETYATEFTNDKKATKNLKKLNVKIHDNLVDKTSQHVLKSKKKRRNLHELCTEIQKKYREFEANAPSKSVKTLHGTSSSSSENSSKVTVLPDPKKPKDKTHTSTSSNKAPDPAVPVPDPAAPVPDPAVKPAKKPVKKIKIRVGTAEQLKKFITTMKPSSVKEATALLKALEKELSATLEAEEIAFNSKGAGKKKHLRQKFESQILTRANGNALLIRMNEIKEEFRSDDQAFKQFKQAHLQLATEIRRSFFAEVLEKAAEQIATLQNNMTDSDNTGTPGVILLDWQMKLIKCKPIAIPKYFHCTIAAHVNTIIQHPIGIQGQPPGKRKGYPGAFASSVPEMNPVGSYGDYCFALSDHIEAKVNKNYPIVTNVSQIGDSGEPVYLGKAPDGPRKKGAKQPRIWLGFKQDFALRRPDKTKNPLDYYEDTTFALFATMAANDTEWEKVNQVSQKELHDRKIRLLIKSDFDAIVSLIHRSFHFTLPADWGTGVVSPDNCGFVTPQGAHPLKSLKYVVHKNP